MVKIFVAFILLGMLSIASATNIEGFRDMQWGDSPKKLGKNLVRGEYNQGKLTEYTKKSEKLSIGSAIVEEINYDFYDNKLYRVYIQYSTDTNYENLKYALTVKYGEPNKPHSHLDWYYWKSDDGKASISLEYNRISSAWNSGSGHVILSINKYDADISTYTDEQQRIEKQEKEKAIKKDL